MSGASTGGMAIASTGGYGDRFHRRYGVRPGSGRAALDGGLGLRCLGVAEVRERRRKLGPWPGGRHFLEEPEQLSRYRHDQRAVLLPGHLNHGLQQPQLQRHGHRLAGCAVARRHRQRGGGSIGNGGAARAAFMAGFDPAGHASRRRVLAPRVSGRSRDRRHRHDRTGTHAGRRSAQHEIAPARPAGRAAAGRSHVLCTRRGHEPATLPEAPYAMRRRCGRTTAQDRQRQNLLFCAAQPRRTHHRQAAHSRHRSVLMPLSARPARSRRVNKPGSMRHRGAGEI